MGDETSKPKRIPAPERTPFTETKWFRRGRRFLRWGGMGALCAAALILLGYLVLKSQPLPAPEQPLTTRIYSDDGTLIDELHSGEKRDYVPLEDIPPALINATIAVEDREFYNHIGISPRAVLRAAWADLKALAIVEGGSTITQQLARNLYLHHDRTWLRKLQEMKYALQLEMHFAKEDILEMYLNEIYFGHQAYGVGQAAAMYFGKKPKDLTAAECVLLAGIPKGAGTYSPYLHPDNAKARQAVVLQAMLEEGYVTLEEARRIKTQTLTYETPRPAETKAPYFRDYVKKVAVERYGLTEEQLESGGLRIETTLDLDLQEQAEQAVAAHIDSRSDVQAALVAVEAETGHIKALVGGTDYRISEYNRVLARRQPGSAFKPLLYLAALENGMTPASMAASEPTRFTFGDGETYEPQNYRGQYAHRPITMREALVRSDNIYAVKTHFSLGRDALVDAAARLGIREPLEPHPSLALGAAPASLLEMTEAYTAIARLGERTELTGIARITDQYGDVIVEVTPERERVAPQQEAFVLTHMMQGVFDDREGTGHIVRQMVSRPLAGKTGSTGRDSWLIGFDPHLVAGVWVGKDQNETLSATEARAAKWVWGTFMQKGKPRGSAQTFPVPEGVNAVTIDPVTGMRAARGCPGRTSVAFVSGTEPAAVCDAHRGGPAEKSKQAPPENADSASWWDKIKKWWKRP